MKRLIAVFFITLLSAIPGNSTETLPKTEPAAKSVVPQGKASPRKPKEPTYKVLSRMLQEQLGNQPWDISREFVERIIAEAPADSPELASALLATARYAASHERHGEAILYYQHWYENGKESDLAPDVMIELGREYRTVGAIASAIDAFYSAMRASRYGGTPLPATKAAQWEVAETSYQLHDWERSHKLFEMFTNGNREESLLTQSAYYRLGDCSRALGDHSQTVVDYTRALAHNPDHPFAPEARLELLNIYMKRENYDTALNCFHELAGLIQKMDTKNAIYWKRYSGEVLFMFMFRLHNHDLTLKILSALEELDQSEAWKKQLAYWRGLVDVKNSEWEAAVKDFHVASAAIPPSSSSAKVENSAVLDKEASAKYATICEWIVDFDQKQQNLLLPTP